MSLNPANAFFHHYVPLFLDLMRYRYPVETHQAISHVGRIVNTKGIGHYLARCSLICLPRGCLAVFGYRVSPGNTIGLTLGLHENLFVGSNGRRFSVELSKLRLGRHLFQIEPTRVLPILDTWAFTVRRTWNRLVAHDN